MPHFFDHTYTSKTSAADLGLQCCSAQTATLCLTFQDIFYCWPPVSCVCVCVCVFLSRVLCQSHVMALNYKIYKIQVDLGIKKQGKKKRINENVDIS